MACLPQYMANVDVSLKATFCACWKIAFRTFLLTLPSVGHFVAVQNLFLVGGEFAFTALKWLFPIMSWNVFLKTTCLIRWKQALCALVCLLPIMDEHVLFKSWSPIEWFAALGTSEALFATVNEHMLSEISCLVRWIVALRTLVLPLPSVSEDVFKVTGKPNDLLHSSQWWDFSPLWVIMWHFKVWAWANDLSHCSQLCLFTLVWLSKCLLLDENDLRQTWQVHFVDIAHTFAFRGVTWTENKSIMIIQTSAILSLSF